LFGSCSYQWPHSGLWRHSGSLTGHHHNEWFDHEEPRHLTTHHWDVRHKEDTVNRHKYDSFWNHCEGSYVWWHLLSDLSFPQSGGRYNHFKKKAKCLPHSLIKNTEMVSAKTKGVCWVSLLLYCHRQPRLLSPLV
jgi:hypothetical protein